MSKRLTIYPLSLLFSVILLILPSYLSNPQRNIRAAARSAALNTQASHQTFASYFKIFPNRGYILVLYTGNQTAFSPTEFLTITKINQELTVDLINGAGIANVSQLSGNTAAEYLKKHQIKLDTFDSLISTDE